MKRLCKRMLALVTALVLVTGTFTAIPAFGSEFSYDGNDVGNSPTLDFRIDVLSQSAAPGQYVDVVLVIAENAFGVNTLGLTITYDSTILQSISVIPGNAMSLPTPPSVGENPMQLNFYAVNPLENFEYLGHLAAIRFRIHDNAPSGSTPITVTPVHAYYITNDLSLICELWTVGITQGAVNVCPLYCACLNCANESDFPNLIAIVPPQQNQAVRPRIHMNRWQAYIGDWGLPPTVDIIVTPFDPIATANVSWGPLTLRSSLGGWWLPEFYSVGTVTLPDDVTNINSVCLEVRAWVDVFCPADCDCPVCEYEAWQAYVEYREWRHQQYLAWRAYLEYREWRYQQYLAWRAHVEYQEWRYQQYREWRAYVEWREWLCATNQCDCCN